MNVFRTLQPEQKRDLGVLFGAGLLFWSSLASMLPTLSLYVKQGGATDWQVGIVMGAFAIGLLVFRPWLGKLADRRNRKLVMLIGLAAVAIAPLGYLMTTSIPALIAIRAFHGLSIAAFTTGFSALVADISPPANRGEIIGYMTLVNPIGVALGPALGGFLLESGGYTPIFLLAAGLGLAGIICLSCLRLPAGEAAPQRPEATSSKRFWQLMLNPRLRIPILVLLLIGLAFGTLAIFVPLYIRDAGVPLNPGLFYTAAAVSSFVVRLLIGRASDRLGRGRFITLGLMLYGIAMTVLWLAHSAVAFLLAGVLEGAGGGIFIPMIVTLVADRSQAQERGQIYGVTLAGFDLGMAIAGPVMGGFASFFGYRLLFGIAGALAFLALVIFIGFSSKDLPHSLRFALSSGRDVYALPQGNP